MSEAAGDGKMGVLSPRKSLDTVSVDAKSPTKHRSASSHASPVKKRRILMRSPGTPESTHSQVSAASCLDEFHDEKLVGSKDLTDYAFYWCDVANKPMLIHQRSESSIRPADMVVHDDGFMIGLWREKHRTVMHRFELSLQEYNAVETLNRAKMASALNQCFRAAQ